MRAYLILASLLLSLATPALADTTVPFQMIDNRIVVQASINGVPGFSMIVDTGADGMTITPEVAQRLHIAEHSGGTVGGAGAGRLAFYNAKLRDVALGNLHLGHQATIVGDLGPIQRGIGFPHLDGIIGYDTIGSGFLKIDVDRNVLTISPNRIAAPAGAHQVSFTTPDGLLHLKVAINGMPGTVILDTGDRWSFTVFEKFGRRNGFYNVTPSVRNALTGFGVGGPIHGDVFLASIDAFGFTIPNVVTRAPLGKEGIFSASAELGSLGNGLLSRFNSVFDGKHRTLTVWPNSRFSEVERYDPLGMWIAQGDNGPIIADITPGGAAERGGLQAGETILSIDGRSTAAWSIPDIRTWLLQQQNGSSISVELQSPSGTRTTKTATLVYPLNE